MTLSAGVLARDHLLPVTPLLKSLLPLGGLQRGTTVLVTPRAARKVHKAAGSGSRAAPGATTLALELLAGVSAAGHWCAAVGLADLGLLAAAERGIVLERFVVVSSPGPAGRWQQVVATFLDGMDAVLFAPAAPVRPGDARRLSARARERGSLLVVLDRFGRWSEPAELRCSVLSSAWEGLEDGYGLLGERSMEIEVTGRGAAARPRRAAMSLAGAELSA